MQLIFATKNENKVKELHAYLHNKIDILSLKDVFPAGIQLSETGNTFQENALEKVKAVYLKTGKACFAEDSGLVVKALDGAPGIYSSRYAGEDGNDAKNNEKLLKELKDVEDRSAYFIAVIALYDGEDVYYFEGKCHGRIGQSLEGEDGFGYDPLFIPDGYENSFAILGMEVKNKISHRVKALAKFRDFLEKFR